MEVWSTGILQRHTQNTAHFTAKYYYNADTTTYNDLVVVYYTAYFTAN